MDEAEARQEEIRDYILEKPHNVHIICGTAGSGKSYLVASVIPLFLKQYNIDEVVFLGYCYRHAKALQDVVALGDSVKNQNMSLHKFMGVEPHDAMEAPPQSAQDAADAPLQLAHDAHYFDKMCANATYPTLVKGTRTLVVIEEMFFSPRLVASIIVFLAGRPDVFVVACGDPGQIARSPGTTKYHASEVFWSRLSMDSMRPVDLHVLHPYSFRQTSPVLRSISSEIEMFNQLPINTMLYKSEDIFAAVIPDAAIMDWMVTRKGTRFWFVSSRENANSYHSQYVSLTDERCIVVLSAPDTPVYLSTDDGMYETAKSLSTKDGRRIPCSTPCTALRVAGRSVVLRVIGYEDEVLADFTCKNATGHPIRPVYFNTLDSIQGNTVKVDMLVHFSMQSRIPDAGLYVCFTRPTSPSIFYCTSSFLSRVQTDAMQRRPVCHPSARFLYTKDI